MEIATQELASACRVLEEEADLADAIPPADRDRVLRECLAETLTVSRGQWEVDCDRGPEGQIGLLVLDGVLLRRVRLAGRFGAEVLGGGDILQSCEGDSDSPTLRVSSGYQVIEPARLAVLDERFGECLGRYPALASLLIGRALRRSRNLVVNMAIVHQARVDVRLRMLLWHLAARWGRVRNGSVGLPLRLTHDALADLTAANRTTVSSALSQLAREGLVYAEKGGWLLVGDPPEELLELEQAVPASPRERRASRTRRALDAGPRPQRPSQAPAPPATLARRPPPR